MFCLLGPSLLAQGAEYDRLEKLVEKRQIELVEVRAQYERREFERPDDLKRQA
jgi:hypothetical protein